ncbi:hypothetical protein [Demequina sp. NBRC 110057]|uniref:hypothetical protein n=1 Tax=Demequina sp. NBRC 110057 TaxID=1570346 RepID=UPI000A07A40B|nr:hypothetical protein [Demequina sp. NBRC 110057]
MRDKYGNRQLSTGWSIVMAGVAALVGMGVVIGLLWLTGGLGGTGPEESPTATAATLSAP